jgi:pimeloyl-ACP methyl ester carboxylesterase
VPATRVGDLDIVWDIAGPPDAAPILMINGLGAPREGWILQVPALAESYRVITYDNRDVGQTGAGHAPRAYDMAQFARDATGLIETLDLGPVHVIGASMGGAIAQELVLARPDLVRSVQIVCSWPRTDPWLAELIDQWKTLYATLGSLAWSRNTWLWVFTYRWFANADAVAAQLAAAEEYPYPQTSDMFARQCDAIIGFDALDRLPTITVPTHVIAGAEDLLTPLRFSHQIAGAIPNARLTVLPDVGHGMFWEATAAFNGALLRFLDDTPNEK